MKVKVALCVSDSLRPHALYSPWNSPGQKTGVGSLSLLQGSNSGLPYCRWILYQLNCKESPGILEWLAYPFSSGSSWPRNQTGVFCIAGGFFTNWNYIDTLPSGFHKWRLWARRRGDWDTPVPQPPTWFGGGSDSKESAGNAGDLGSIPGSGRPPGERNGCLLQYSWVENSMAEEPDRL